MAKSRAKARVLRPKGLPSGGVLDAYGSGAKPESKNKEDFAAAYISDAIEASLLITEMQKYLLKAMATARTQGGVGATLWYTHDVEALLDRLRPVITTMNKRASGAIAALKQAKEKK
jgi:hypothetical protein